MAENNFFDYLLIAIMLSVTISIQLFVRNMEFLAKHGPLRQLDHYGRKLNFFQYYLIDVFAFVALVLISIVFVIGFAIVRLCRCIKSTAVKRKLE